MQNQPIILLEACVETFNKALIAEKNGAHRIELCDRLDLGGTTPPTELVQRLLSVIQIPVMAMVRPRGGDFVYTDAEFLKMQQQIIQMKSLGCHGVVFGLLTPASEIDVERTRILTELARPMQVTFHKAFDECSDLLVALNAIKTTKVDRLLTSGGKATALEAADVLELLIKNAAQKPQIIVAGKVNHNNLDEHRALISSAKEFHGRKIVPGL